MEMTLDDFYNGGGVTNFQDNIAAALGIHASRVKVVQVYEGSVAINYIITDDDTIIIDENATEEEQEALLATVSAELTAVLADLSSQLSTNAISLGGEILTFDVVTTSTDSSVEVAAPVEVVADTSNMVVTEDSTSSTGISATGSSATSSYSSDADYGFSTSEAMAAFAAVAMPTAYLLNKNPQVIEVINELYNNYDQGND